MLRIAMQTGLRPNREARRRGVAKWLAGGNRQVCWEFIDFQTKRVFLALV
jgi:hypothetical protein